MIDTTLASGALALDMFAVVARIQTIDATGNAMFVGRGRFTPRPCGRNSADMHCKARPVFLCKTLGDKCDDRALRVEKPGVVRIAVNDRVTPEGSRDVRPEDHSHRAAGSQDVPGLFVISGRG